MIHSCATFISHETRNASSEHRFSDRYSTITYELVNVSRSRLNLKFIPSTTGSNDKKLARNERNRRSWEKKKGKEKKRKIEERRLNAFLDETQPRTTRKDHRDDNATNVRQVLRILSKFILFVNQGGRKNETPRRGERERERERDRPIRVSENTQVASHNATLPRKTLWRSLVSAIEEKEK